jgi:flavin-dependent dehydrogenase
VVRRDEFDQWLVQQGEQRGVMVRQGEGVRQITPGPEWVEVVTEQATFRAKVVVAADGSRSFVRQKLFGPQQPPPTKRMARLLEILTPERATERAAFREGVAVFDFTPMGEGLQGYYWDFPSLVKGQFFMNRGVFDSRARTERPRILLKELFQQLLLRRKRKLADYPLKGHPIYWFNRRGQFARPRVILAGDAAGVDPLLGEGISFALAYGQVAAAAINEAFIRQDFSFTTYKEKILIHNILSQLVLRARLARVAYKFRQSWLIRLGWRLFPLAIQLLVWTHRTAVLVKSPRTVRLKNADSQD